MNQIDLANWVGEFCLRCFEGEEGSLIREHLLAERVFLASPSKMYQRCKNLQGSIISTMTLHQATAKLESKQTFSFENFHNSKTPKRSRIKMGAEVLRTVEKGAKGFQVTLYQSRFDGSPGHCLATLCSSPAMSLRKTVLL